MSTPTSTIFVCTGVRLSSRYDHSIYFENEDAQVTYFKKKAVRTFTAYSYIRKHWKLKLEATMEEANLWNYLFFQNGTGNKYWYYFINNIEYINDSTVELTLELDVLQTYLFDFNFLPCFIERQHTVSDEIGEHTLLENLEMGDFITSSDTKVNFGYSCILIQSTVNPVSGDSVLGAYVNGVYSGLGLYAVNTSYWQAFALLLDDLAESGKLDGIVNMWMYPQELVDLGDGTFNDSQNIVQSVKGIKTLDRTFAKATRLAVTPDNPNGYAPKNNKLLCYPFNFLYVSNNSGTSAVYRYERFTNDRCEFEVYGALSPVGMVKLVPQYYNGIPTNHDEGITLSGFPTCAWNADVYKIWLAQNQNTHNLVVQNASVSFLAGAGAVGVGIATGNLMGVAGGVGAMYNGFASIQSLTASKADKAIEPHQARGNHSVNVNFANQAHTFLVYFKTIDEYHARIIDDYFTMYGYQVNRISVPDIDARPHFTFTKTQGCHIQSFLCNEDTVKIEQIFDNGITFWKDGDQIGNYTLDNRPV